MKIPPKFSSFKLFLVIFAIYTAVWIALEGELWRAVVMGVGSTAVSLGYGWQKWLGGRLVEGWKWWGVTAVSGLLFGLGSSLLSLVFMAVKTGLHAHGPEFTPAEINWILQQTPIWTASGLLTALGLALLFKGRN